MARCSACSRAIWWQGCCGEEGGCAALGRSARSDPNMRVGCRMGGCRGGCGGRVGGAGATTGAASSLTTNLHFLRASSAFQPPRATHCAYGGTGWLRRDARMSGSTNGAQQWEERQGAEGVARRGRTCAHAPTGRPARPRAALPAPPRPALEGRDGALTADELSSTSPRQVQPRARRAWSAVGQARQRDEPGRKARRRLQRARSASRCRSAGTSVRAHRPSKLRLLL
jgi:hypothetical protein